MSSPAKATDQTNTVAIVAVGAVGAILVYVSIVLLQAFYMNDTSAVEDVQDNLAGDAEWRTLRQAQITTLKEYGTNGERVRIPIDRAQALVLEQLRNGNATTLVPAIGPSDQPSLKIDRSALDAAAPVTPGATPVDGTTPPVDGASVPSVDGAPTAPGDLAAPPGAMPPGATGVPAAGTPTAPAAATPAAATPTPPAAGSAAPRSNGR